MTVDKDQPAIDTSAGEGVAGKAALFTTFYVHRKEASPLYERLLTLAQQIPEAFQGNTLDSASKPLLTKSDLPATRDATAILLILNSDGDAATAWETMRRRLRDILHDSGLSAVWWGYTVVYQAVLNERGDADLALNKLLPKVRMPYSSEAPRRPLAKANMEGGRVWMVDVPLKGHDATAAATILIALSAPDDEAAFKSALFGPAMLMSDLIAHKGYAIMRDYSGDPQQQYKNKLKEFWNASDELISDLEGQVQKPGRLNEVTRWYSTLTSVGSKFNRMNISMARQLHNYDTWRAQAEGNGIVEYHHGHLEMARQELELLVAEGEDALGVADKALSMARVELGKAQESNQRLISLLLAVVSVTLAAPSLVRGLDLKNLWGLNSMELFLTTIVTMSIIAVLIVTLIFSVGRWRGRKLIARGFATLRAAVRAVLKRR